jgi:HK97 family phage major capsid protein
MPALIKLKEEMRKASLQAQTIVDDANLSFSDKKEALDKAEADIKAFSEQIAELTRRDDEQKYLDTQRKKYSGMAEVVDAEKSGADTVERSTKSVSEQLFGSQDFMTKAYGPDRPNVFSTGPIELKATLTETTAGGTTGAGLAQPDVRPGILPILFQRLTIQDLIPGGQTGSALVRYLKETVATNAAAAVAEGAAKPASTLNFAAVDEPVKKVATTLKVTDELFADVPALRSYVDNRLMLFVQIQEEAQLASGSGSGANITGLLNRSGLTAAQAKGADTGVDAIYKDITKIRIASFLDPDAIVLHPTDWQNIRLSKDANGQYYGGGPFTGAYGNGGMPGDMLWGLRVVPTQAMTAGTALVGAFGTAAQVFTNGGLRVEATNSNEDDFLNNLIAIRAEVRLALAVYRPSAFSTVTGL